MPRPSLTPQGWAEVRAEYEAGMLSLRAISAAHGISESAIRSRARREMWPERAVVSEEVRAVVRSAHNAGQDGPRPRIALLAFERVLDLIRSHRQFAGSGRRAAESLLAHLDAYLTQRTEGGRTLTLREMGQVASIIQKYSSAVASLVPVERRLFGLDDRELPSEFDMLTPDDLALLSARIRDAVGFPASDDRQDGARQ
jgi:hypothetical protein